MRHLQFIWTHENEQHLAEHGVTPQEAEEVVRDPARTEFSKSSGRPIAMGYTTAGRWLAVVYERVDGVTVYPITAFEPED